MASFGVSSAVLRHVAAKRSTSVSSLLLVSGGTLLALAGVTDAAPSSLEASSSTAAASNPKAIAAGTKPASVKRRMTAIGHFSILSETLHNPSIVTFVMTLQSHRDRPWTVDRFSQLWRSSEMPHRHPRFHLVADADAARGHFTEPPTTGATTTATKSTDGDSTDETLHVSESLPPLIPRTDVLQRIRSLQTEPWDLSEKLWHIYLVPWCRAGASGTVTAQDAARKKKTKTSSDDGESLLLFQGHHALADGASMAAALLDLTDEAPEIRAQVLQEVEKRFGSSFWKRLYQRFLLVLWMITGSLEAAWYQFTLYLRNMMRWHPNPWSVLERLYLEEEQEGDAKGPDRTVSFCHVGSVKQAKWVAQTLAGRKATVNDLFCSAVTRALARQLEWHRQRLAARQKSGNQLQPLPSLPYLNLAVPVHLNGGVILPGESVSNSIGAFCVRLPGETAEDGAQSRLQKVHKELSVAKKRPTAFLSHAIAQWTTFCLPRSWVPWLYRHASAGASCVVTNVRGPERELHLDGDRVSSLHGFVPLPTGIPIGVVVGSYNGQVQLTVTAQPWAVPDADRFLQWVLQEYLQLLREAQTAARR